MARSPDGVLSTVAPDAGGAPYQRIDASPASFGAGVAQAAEKFGQQGVQAADAWGTRFNDLATDDAFNNLQTEYGKATFGDPNDPTKKGYYQMQGREALDNRAAASQSLESIRLGIRNNLQNDDQRRLFDSVSRRFQSITLAEMGRHADREYRMWGEKVQDATQDIQTQAIAAQPFNDMTFNNSVVHGMSGVVRFNQERYGPNVDPEVLEQASVKYASKAVRARVLGMAETDAGAAATWLKTGTVPKAAGQDTNGQTLYRQVPVQQMIDAGTYAALQAHVEAKGDLQGGMRDALEANAASGSTSGGMFSDRIIRRESGNRPDAKDPGSSAAGYGGFIDGTWREFAAARPDLFKDKSDAEIMAMKKDRAVVGQAIDWYAAKNAPILTAAGIAPTGDNLAVAHIGPGNAIPLLKASPSTPVSAILSEAVLKANPAWAPMTAGQLVSSLSVGMPNLATPALPSPPPVGSTNSVPDHSMDRAVGYANLIAKFNAGGISENRFKAGLSALATMQAVEEKFKRDAAEQANNEYVQQILRDPTTFKRDEMLASNALTGAQKHALDQIYNGEIEKRGDIRQYGPDYTKIYAGIFAPEGDPNKINDVNDILRAGAPGGGLTIKGVSALSGIFRASRKDPDEAGIHVTAASLLTYAKTHLSFEQDTGFVKIRDPKGEAIFNAQFVPKFETALAAWRKAGKDPMQFLTQENVDKMMAGMRSPADMARDRMLASGQVAEGDVEAPGTPTPPVPEGLNPREWSSIMSGQVPIASNERPYTHAAWAAVLRKLAADPKLVADFDAKFGKQGYSGADLLRRMKTPQAPANDPTLDYSRTP